jgi:hypothetical protein
MSAADALFPAEVAMSPADALFPAEVAMSAADALSRGGGDEY